MPPKLSCPLFDEQPSTFQKLHKQWRFVVFFIASLVVFFCVLQWLSGYKLEQKDSTLNIIILIVSFLLSFLMNQFYRNKIDNDNQLQDLDNAKEIIFKRDVRLKEAACKLQETFSDFKSSSDKDLLTDEQIFFLSSTDLFVEKAQAVLTRRGKFLIRAGIATMVGAFFLLTMGFVIAIFGQNHKIQDAVSDKVDALLKITPEAPKSLTGQPDQEAKKNGNVPSQQDKAQAGNHTNQESPKVPTGKPDQEAKQSIEEYLQSEKYKPQAGWQLIILSLFRTLGITAYIYVSVKLLISLSRSFFHEGLSLFERRHALRFGRMYLYLKKGVVSEKWLETFFQWNKETKTSFLDITPELVTETLLHKLFGVFSDAGHAVKNTKINTGF